MRRRHRFDLYWVIGLSIITIGFFVYSNTSAGERGVEKYSEALKAYKSGDFELAYSTFAKVPYNSNLKQAALFRQARCATNLDKKQVAIKKYKRIVHSHSKTSIVPISEYNMAYLMYELNDKGAKRQFKKIIKKYPSSDYAIASNYYLGKINNTSIPESGKHRLKAKNKSFIYFKTYIEKAPDGRYSLDAIDEIKNLKLKLSGYDNLLIAKSYYANGEYAKAKEHFNLTQLSESWADFAKNEYKLGNKDKANEFAEKGLKEFAAATDPQDVYDVIDNYVATFSPRKNGINKLSGLGLKYTGADYVAYLNCNEVVASDAKEACYRTLYEKYPDGQFSADALYNVFINKYLQKRYYDAQRLGYLHVRKFINVKSSPAVTYYMGKISFKLKHYESANNYFKQVLAKYPDSYYALRASNNLYKDDGFLPFLDINPKPVVFPYIKSLDKNLVVNLALLKDYDLVEELCKKDKFIQSWIAYEKGDYTVSAILARNAMEELESKPPFEDLRWRLVYPLHYFNIVEKVKGGNNPIILQSIIKEESHFNPFAKSSAGANGLMQLMPATYNEVVKKNNIPSTLSPEVSNITAGSFYYSGLKRSLLNRDLYAITAYNGGIGSVTSWFTKLLYSDTDEFVEQIPYPETKNYVKKVLRSYWMYGNIY
jgi:soluble lytic murein transglycosylase